MPCIPIVKDGKQIGFSCTFGRSSKKCSVPGCDGSMTKMIILCDFPLTGTMKGKTCSKPLCSRHATHVGPNRDYCPTHAKTQGSQEPEPASMPPLFHYPRGSLTPGRESEAKPLCGSMDATHYSVAGGCKGVTCPDCVRMLKSREGSQEP
jgi:hypothetical protein